jgi:exodeoxyribonuclease VII large subunit
MDLLDDPTPGSNTPEFSVTEIAGTVRKLVEAELGWVRVKGEVGRVVLARSGHLYFDLKDDRNVLSCMTWKGQVPGLGVMPEEGMEVVAEGKMTASGMQSKFSLNAQRLSVAGEGAFMALLEKRKKMLAAEGLFDEGRKKPLPYLPDIIGVVTSTQGVVIRDILHRLRDRFPRKVLVWPVAVQGQSSKDEVAAAIAGFNALTPGGALPRPDLIIVARGGGSIEDLWSFNEEVVARAAAASDIPLISAVGHETDTTLIDFVSDKRAPTPTAAAELAVPVRLDLLAWVSEQEARLKRALSQGVAQREQRLRDLARALPNLESLLANPRQRYDITSQRLTDALLRAAQLKRQKLTETSGALRPSVLTNRTQNERRRVNDLGRQLAPSLARTLTRPTDHLSNLAARLTTRNPSAQLDRQRADLDRLSQRFATRGQNQLEAARQKLDALERVRNSVGYKQTLKRGYAVVRGDGAPVTTAKAAKAASSLEIEFQDGTVSPSGASSKPAKKPKPEPPEQGSLL